ncbi:hypothetical protein ACQP04_03470 [Pseudonocardia halophobica]|uniref:hypothetical protein n=1 Tax=Pseudonocardia halophobica TaxID=29401 RepID=UPI003D8E4DC9
MTTVTARPRAGRDPIRLPVPRRVRLGLLVVHIVATAAWIGLDVALAVLVFVPMLDASWTAACHQVLPLLFWPLLTTALLSLVSGTALGLVTRWGLVRHWWVAIKLVTNLLLVTLIVVLLGPGLEDAGRHGRALAAGLPDVGEVPRLFMPPSVSISLLVVATVLSVWKPRGRVRKD